VGGGLIAAGVEGDSLDEPAQAVIDVALDEGGIGVYDGDEAVPAS